MIFALPLVNAYTVELGVSDFIYGTLFLFLIVFLSYAKKEKIERNNPGNHNRYFVPNVFFKLLFAAAFGAIYLFYYKGGDTVAYFKGAQALNNLFWYSPTDYFKELISTPDATTIILRFNGETGYPPGWIYRDPSSFYVSKILSVFMLFIGQSYVVMTMLMAYISATFSWKVYEIVRFYQLTSDRLAAIAVLFIPSVSFWCSGVSKDTLVLFCVYGILIHFFALYNRTSQRRFSAMIWVLLYVLILFHLRSFMLFTVAAPLLAMMSTRFIRRYDDTAFLANSMRFFMVSIGMGLFLLFLRWQGEEISKTTEAYLNEAEVQQTDFAQNETYGDNRYKLDITSYTPLGMLSVAPQAIFTAIYRPGLWEARSPLLLISGLETALFIYFTILFLFRENLWKKIILIRKNELLVFSFLFALILAYFAGYTSILFGVLVRFKAPLIPFLLLVLTVSPKHFTSQERKSQKA